MPPCQQSHHLGTHSPRYTNLYKCRPRTLWSVCQSQYTPHHRMPEGDWYSFLNVPELHSHKSHYIRPSPQSYSSHRLLSLRMETKISSRKWTSVKQAVHYSFHYLIRQSLHYSDKTGSKISILMQKIDIKWFRLPCSLPSASSVMKAIQPLDHSTAFAFNQTKRTRAKKIENRTKISQFVARNR